MAKDIFSLQIDFKNIRISKSILRNTILTASVMILLYIVIIIFSLNVFIYFLNDTLDSRLKHELEKVYASFQIENDSLIITNPIEFSESDFVNLSESSFFLQIYDHKNRTLLQSKNISLFHPIEKRFPDINSDYYFHNETTFDNNLRVAYQKLLKENGELLGFIQIAVFKDRLTAVVDNIIWFNAIIFPFALVLILLSSYWIVKKSFSPIKKIIRVAEKISATNLNERIQFDSDPGDDLTVLKNTLNNLFERLEYQVKQISEFSDNASHQLMTPLTALNTELEYLLMTHNEKSETKKSLEELKVATEQMIHIIKSLLLLSKDSIANSNRRSVFSLTNLLRLHLTEIYKKQNIELDVQENLFLRGNEEYFLIVMRNLIDNGFKYSDYQQVIVEAKMIGKKIIIKCIDRGVGIPVIERDKVFERFYRSESAEKLGIKGFGLGLSLVRFIVTSMEGSIEIQDNSPNGTIFIIHLPTIEME
jgi:signal transduction histidine kinase